ncbi:MAG: ABC transporter ATP-binding protein, partial [Acidobacteria bacterium]|nr:ABC transporter ATP-binding protein [Acidobacteriota bacterium]
MAAISHKWRVLSRLTSYIRRHTSRLLAGFICIIITNIFLVVTPWVMGNAVDSLYQSLTREILIYYAGLIIVIAILEGVFRFLMRRLIIGVSRDIEYELRNDLFAHLETLSMPFYQKNKTGELMSRVTNDLSNVRMLVGPGIMYTGSTLILAIFAIAMMISIDWKLTLFSLLPLPGVSLSVRHFGKRIHDLTEEAQAKLADLSARVQESLAGNRVVKAFVQEEHEISTFHSMNMALVDKNRELIRVTSVFYPTMQLMIGLAVVVV